MQSGDVALPPQVGLHPGAEGRQEVVAVHEHVDETVHHGTEIGWKCNIGKVMKLASHGRGYLQHKHEEQNPFFVLFKNISTWYNYQSK